MTSSDRFQLFRNLADTEARLARINANNRKTVRGADYLATCFPENADPGHSGLDKARMEVLKLSATRTSLLTELGLN